MLRVEVNQWPVYADVGGQAAPLPDPLGTRLGTSMVNKQMHQHQTGVATLLGPESMGTAEAVSKVVLICFDLLTGPDYKMQVKVQIAATSGKMTAAWIVGLRWFDRLLPIGHIRSSLDDEVGTSQYVDDLIDMKIINVKYATQQMPKSLSSSENILDGVSFRMPQGKVIVLQGGERQGKSTLLRLIAGELPPTSGEIFIPPHLTVLQVHEAPSFIPGSLKRNLLFGISGGDDEQMLGDITRVVGICERLRMAQSLISRLHQDWMSGADEDDDEWLSALTSTDKMTIHLARAFIANPHVLVMHKPLMRFYQEELRKATMVTIEEFVKYRGLGLNNAPDEITKRRTRTVVLSQFHSLELDHAEMVFQLENGQVLQNQAPARGTTG
ncbi:ssuB1 [Symbiodinium microadriaticum]|nr:ssuB1 [Symbiodinium microadriaticum]